MITKGELQRIARRKGIDLAVMEKDYALTWALKAIYSSQALADALVFKGGTCISKIYAENYRLSEDLDFTAYKGAKPTVEGLREELGKAFEQAKKEGGPELKVKDFHSNPGYITFQIQYNAALGQPGSLKLDISLGESVIFASNRLPLREKLYGDIGEFKIHCYALQEIAIEKLRSLFQRGKSRDYYDIWRIMATPELKKQVMADEASLRAWLREKCDRTNVPYMPELIFDEKQLEEAGHYWEGSLGRLVSELPKFEEVIAKLKEIFFEESELSEFAKDYGIIHLDDINRREKTEPLLARAVELLLTALKSKRKREVMRAIRALGNIYSMRDYMPKISREQFDLMLAPANDKDREISGETKRLMDIASAYNQRAAKTGGAQP